MPRLSQGARWVPAADRDGGDFDWASAVWPDD